MATTTETMCRHCGLPNPSKDLTFCCIGCEAAFLFLTQCDLSHYYTLKNEAGLPAQVPQNRFSELDDPELKSSFKTDSNTISVQFYVEGVHCAACIWVLEKLNTLVPNIYQARLTLANSVLTVTASNDVILSDVAVTISKLGYTPRLVEPDTDIQLLNESERRKELVRLGVAFALNGNIMLMTIPLYGGAAGQWAVIFNWLSGILCGFVVTYCAWPFYRSAYAALRRRSINLDTPIAIAVAVGYLISIAELIWGKSHVYFDSIGMLTALLLASRFILKTIQTKTAASTESIWNRLPHSARQIRDDGTIVTVRLSQLHLGDRIEVPSQSPIPVDGIVVEGNSHVNMAIITGESFPQSIKSGSNAIAGTFNLDGRLVIQVTAIGPQSRIGQILSRLQTLQVPAVVQVADKIARRLLVVVLSISAVLVVWSIGIHSTEGVRRALALLIVTCPCALGIATPLAVAVSISRAAQRGVLIRNPDVLEILPTISTIILDKTGTITEGQMTVTSLTLHTPETPQLHQVAAHLESQSSHPIGSAIRRYYSANNFQSLDAPVIDTPGQGVSCDFAGVSWRIGRSPTDSQTPLQAGETECTLYQNEVAVVDYRISDGLRPESSDTIKTLRQRLAVRILSGDRGAAVRNIAQKVGIPENDTIADATPESKLSTIQRSHPCMMVGDGANDALALKQSDVGVAVYGSLDIGLKSADVALISPGISPILTLLAVGLETRYVMRRNFIISLIYNVIFGTLAVSGYMNPLVAAVIMPVSSISVIASSLIRIKEPTL